jgi:hypothetical protein
VDKTSGGQSERERERERSGVEDRKRGRARTYKKWEKDGTGNQRGDEEEDDRKGRLLDLPVEDVDKQHLVVFGLVGVGDAEARSAGVVGAPAHGND